MATTEAHEVREIDLAAVEAFAGQVAETVVHGVVTLMIDLGHRTGLFEAAAEGPATAAELAARAGLSERYVREWLGSMTTAGVVRFDPDGGRYELPPEHAAVLTGGGAANMAPLGPFVTHLAHHVPAVAEAFRTGAGVPYAAYRPDFTDVMDDLGRRTYDEVLLPGVVPLADGLEARLRAGIAVADIGCGTGHTLNLLARAFPASSFVGFDIAEDALQRGREEAAAWGLANARFERLDVRSLPAAPRYDLVCAFDAVHDQADPALVLRRVREALADDGTFLMVDINASSDVVANCENPLAPLIYGISVLHCMSVSLAEGGAGLGTAWGRELACRMLADAGFGAVDVHDMPGDPFNLVYVCRP